MGSCASTGVSQAGSPAKNQLTNGIQQNSLNIQEMNQMGIINVNEEIGKMGGQDKKIDNPRSNYVLSGIDLLDYGVGKFFLFLFVAVWNSLRISHIKLSIHE
ncbi:unnamed protein product [Schistosoma curassoni]|uniref:Uncharacterized protein n=1 Tax=Schistosoma curassoni TaxID=6186 RepID=A0A183JHM5_9TREM|nr:unnamed protein product [Schistosoma curassoni]